MFVNFAQVTRENYPPKKCALNIQITVKTRVILNILNTFTPPIQGVVIYFTAKSFIQNEVISLFLLKEPQGEDVFSGAGLLRRAPALLFAPLQRALNF